jgi:predicted RNase H-like nuclease (RuvC/YqgF family)
MNIKTTVLDIEAKRQSIERQRFERELREQQERVVTPEDEAKLATFLAALRNGEEVLVFDDEALRVALARWRELEKQPQ